MSEHLSPDEIKDRLRTGWTLDPVTPGLKVAARDLFRPIIESMKGREIIYRCRVPWLMRVDHLQVENDGFHAVATPIQEIRDGFMSLQYDKPLEFGADHRPLLCRPGIGGGSEGRRGSEGTAIGN